MGSHKKLEVEYLMLHVPCQRLTGGIVGDLKVNLTNSNWSEASASICRELHF